MNQEEFRETLKEWVELSESIEVAGRQLKELREKADTLKERITLFMQQQGVNQVTMDGGRITIQCSERTSKTKPKKDEAMQRMTQFLGDEDRAKQLYNFVWIDGATSNKRSYLRKRKRQEDDE